MGYPAYCTSKGTNFFDDNFRRTAIRDDTIPVVKESDIVELTPENRYKLINRRCPKCGQRIIGRCGEYPYYLRLDKTSVVFLCSNCTYVRHIRIERQDGTCQMT